MSKNSENLIRKMIERMICDGTEKESAKSTNSLSRYYVHFEWWNNLVNRSSEALKSIGLFSSPVGDALVTSRACSLGNGDIRHCCNWVIIYTLRYTRSHFIPHYHGKILCWIRTAVHGTGVAVKYAIHITIGLPLGMPSASVFIEIWSIYEQLRFDLHVVPYVCALTNNTIDIKVLSIQWESRKKHC